MHSILRFCSKITGSPGKPQIEAEDKCVRFVVGPRELTYAQYPATPSTAFVDGIAASIESAFGLQPGTYRLVDGTNCVWLLSQGLLSGTYTIQPEIRRTNTASYGDETADFRAYAYVSTIRGSEFVTCNIRLVISSALKPYTVKLEQNKVQLVLKPQPNWHLKNWAPASEEQMSVVKTQTNHEIIAKAQTSIQLGATGPHATFGLGGQYRFLYQTEVSEAAKNWQTGYTHYLNEEAFAPAEHLLERQHEWTMMLKDGISKLRTYVDCQATYSLCKEFELMYQQDPGPRQPGRSGSSTSTINGGMDFLLKFAIKANVSQQQKDKCVAMPREANFELDVKLKSGPDQLIDIDTCQMNISAQHEE